jgi:hypothetical protein
MFASHCPRLRGSEGHYQKLTNGCSSIINIYSIQKLNGDYTKFLEQNKNQFGGDYIMSNVTDTLEKLYKEQYNAPIQTRPKPKPGITGEKPGEVKGTMIGDEGSITSFSTKKVNKSRNREFDEDDEVEKEVGDL